MHSRENNDAFYLRSQRLESIIMEDDAQLYAALIGESDAVENKNKAEDKAKEDKTKEDVKLNTVMSLFRLFNDKKDPEKTKVALFLVRYMHQLNQTGWQAIYGDKDQYLSIISKLIMNCKNKVLSLAPEDLDLVLKEGMRFGLEDAYEVYLQVTLLSHTEGFEGQQQEGRRVAARYAKLNKNNFAKKINHKNKLFASMTEEALEAHRDNLNYLYALGALCGENFFSLPKKITAKDKQNLAKILDENILSSEAVFQMAIDLDYSKIIGSLGQYHLEKAITISESGDPFETQKHVDFAEKYFQYVRENTPWADNTADFVKDPRYGKVLAYLGQSKQLDAQKKRQDQTMDSKAGLPYILIGVRYGHEGCVASLLELLNREGLSTEFKATLNECLVSLPVAVSISILNDMLHGNRAYVAGVRELIEAKLASFQTAAATLETLPRALQYDVMVENKVNQTIDYRGQALHVQSGCTVYMVVTKQESKESHNEDEDERKPKNDEYKCYVPFEPCNFDNYPRCWSVLLKDILPEENVYGVKMINPQDSSLYFDYKTGEQRKLKENTQPGKMAVIYFKKYETLRKIRGEGYTREQFYEENLALMQRFDALLKEAGITKDKPSVVPDHSLPLEGEGIVESSSYVKLHVSSRETNEKGEYVPSEHRIENTPENNPYIKLARQQARQKAGLPLVDESEPEQDDLDRLMEEEAKDRESVASESVPSATPTLSESGSSDSSLAAVVSPASSVSSSLVAKPKPSFLTRAFAYYKANPWKAAGLTIGAVLSVGLVVALTIATAGAFPFVAGGIAAAAAALHITVVGASIGALTLGGLSTLGFVGTLGAMLGRTARQKPAAQPANTLVAKPASRSTFAQVFSKLCGGRRHLLIDSVRFESESAVVVAPAPKPARTSEQAILEENRSQQRRGYSRKPSTSIGSD